MIEVPHLEFPFRWGANKHAAVLEQDSEAELMNCVELICSVTLGGLPDQPDLGISDPTFSIRPNMSVLEAQINKWCSRTNVTLSDPPPRQDITLQNIMVLVNLEHVR